MPTGVKKVLGFLREETEPTPYSNRTEVKEVCRVEVYNVTDTWVNLFSTLPASGSPGSVGFNPQQITFTFGTSVHPLTNNLYLQQASGIKKVAPTFWDMTLQYSNSEYQLEPTGENNKNPRNRKDQKNVNPLSRPPVWSSASKTVLKQTYTKGPNPAAGVVGDVIVHENGLAITEPYMYAEEHTTHSFSFNRNFSSFDYNTDIKPYLGKVSTNTIFGAGSAQQYKLVQASCSEEYESFGQGDSRTEYHFIRINVTFEYNPSGWINDSELVSKSTLQLVAGTLEPIIINNKGQVAQEPWPLIAGGAAAPFNALNPANFAILDTGYPETANLSTFVSAYGLVVP